MKRKQDQWISSQFYENIYGQKIRLNIKYNTKKDAVLQEYVIENEPFKVQQWLSMTAVLTAIFLKMGLHSQNNVVLSVIILLLLLALVSRIRRKVREESLLVITSIGVQICTTFLSGSKSCRFIAWENIEGLIINEGITMQRVLFYLAFLTRGSQTSKLVPVFQDTLPRLECLERIYRNLLPLVQPEQFNSANK